MITQGETLEEAIEMAEDALLTSMDFYFEDKRPVPMPSQPKRGEHLIELPPGVTAKVLLLNALLESRIKHSVLAKALSQLQMIFIRNWYKYLNAKRILTCSCGNPGCANGISGKKNRQTGGDGRTLPYPDHIAETSDQPDLQFPADSFSVFFKRWQRRISGSSNETGFNTRNCGCLSPHPFSYFSLRYTNSGFIPSIILMRFSRRHGQITLNFYPELVLDPPHVEPKEVHPKVKILVRDAHIPLSHSGWQAFF